MTPHAGQTVLASNNPGKLREIAQILADVGMQLVPQSEFDIPEAEETGLSFVENAIIKARHAAARSGLPALADDSGIEVDVLGGRPGIHSARYAGPRADDQANLQLLLKEAFAEGEDRPVARYQCVIVFMRHAYDPVPIIASGSWEGYLIREPRGNNGFGYDPIFYVPDRGCTSAELEPGVKNRISHRALALVSLAEQLGRFHTGSH